jgi:hypothetical protein
MPDPRTTNDQPVRLTNCMRCKQPVIFTDRDTTLGDAQGAMTLWPIHADPIALTPAEEVACIILGRHIYLLEASGSQRLHISYQHGKRPTVSRGRRELGRIPHHRCYTPIGTTPVDLPRPGNRDDPCNCLTHPDALQCQPPF